MNRPCSECGSRNWPRKGASCPLCREEEEEDEDLEISFSDEDMDEELKKEND